MSDDLKKRIALKIKEGMENWADWQGWLHEDVLYETIAQTVLDVFQEADEIPGFLPLRTPEDVDRD